MFYLDLFRRLERARVRYLVAGGVAMNLHGVPRMTADLDLVVALEQENLTAALSVIKEMGFVPSVPVAPEGLLDAGTRLQWIKEKNLMAFPFHNPNRPYESVDLLIGLSLDFEQGWRERLKLNVENVTIPVTGLCELIAMKKMAGRPQDLADVDALMRIARRGEKNGGR